MKQFAKLLTLMLAILMLVSAFVACGGDGSPGTEGKGAESEKNKIEYETLPYVEDDIPDDLRFDGQTLTFFTKDDSEHWKYEMDCDYLLGDTLFDAIYYRNKSVEEQLGVTVTTVSQKGSNNFDGAWIDTYRTAVNARTGDFETAAISMGGGAPLAVEGLYYNVIDFPYLSLEKPWWNQKVHDELTMFHALYYLIGDIAVTQISWGTGMFYNKDILDKYFPDGSVNLYQTVKDRKWTIDCMYDIVAQVYEDVDGSGTMTDGDVVGFWDGEVGTKNRGERDAWIVACGIDITQEVSGQHQLTFYSNRTVEAFEKLKALHAQNPGTLIIDSRYTDFTKFENGNVLFYLTRLNSGSIYRTMDGRYGVLPMPMLEENQEGGYRNYVFYAASAVVIVSSLPEEKKEMVGATLELMAAESYRQVTPAYCEVALKTKYAEDAEDSAMYDMIIDSLYTSFGMINGKNLGNINSLFRDFTIDLAQTWEAEKDVYQEKLEQLVDTLDDLSFKKGYGLES